MGRAGLFVFLSVSAAACLRGQAKTQPEVPLAMPSPPERVVEVVDPASPPVVPLPEEPVPNELPRPPQAPPRTDVRPPEPRPEPEPARPSEPPRTSGSAPTLQTAPQQQEGQVERRIRAVLQQATGDLNRINAGALNADARQQLETARRFVSQAEDALRARNLVFASNLADKAAALAAQLAGR